MPKPPSRQARRPWQWPWPMASLPRSGQGTERRSSAIEICRKEAFQIGAIAAGRTMGRACLRWQKPEKAHCTERITAHRNRALNPISEI